MIACDSPTTHSTLAEEFASIRSLSVFAFTVFFSNVPIKRCQKNVTHKITIGKIKIPIEISPVLGNLITVIFCYQISHKPLKILSLWQVSFPLYIPLCYIVQSVFTDSGKGKSKENKIILHSITQNETDMVN